MTAVAFLDRRGRPISREVWRRLSARPGYVSVLSDDVETTAGVTQVRTFWVGVADYRHRLLFCTLADQPDGSHVTWAWNSEADAHHGHHHVCAWAAGHKELPDGARTQRSRFNERPPPAQDH